jgi:cytochrome c
MAIASPLVVNCCLSFQLEMEPVMNSIHFGFLAAAGLCAFSAMALDEDDATALLKEGNCFKCHAIGREKIAPSLSKIAAKYKDKPEALEKLTKHVTVPSEVEIDGSKEEHGQIKTTDAARVQNLVEWILSR